MNPEATDVQRRVVYCSEKVTRQLLVIALALCAVGVAGIYTSYGWKQALAWAMALGGAGWGAYELLRTLFPRKPLVELSPEGLLIRFTSKDIHIPWHQVHGVETVDIREKRGRLNVEVTIPRVTVVLVSRTFFDEAAGDGALIPGPGWSEAFIPKGESVQIALHPGLLPAKSGEIRRAVDARWRAFGDPRRTGRALHAAGEADAEDARETAGPPTPTSSAGISPASS